MTQEGGEAFRRDDALADACVVIAVAAEALRRVVEVDDGHAVEADHAVGIGKGARGALRRADVEASAPQMRGVEADAELMAMFGELIEDGGEILEGVADLAATAGIVLQQEHDALGSALQHTTDAIGEAGDASGLARAGVAADMEDDARRAMAGG